MKFSKKLKKELEDVLRHLRRAEIYLKKDKIAGIAWKTDSPNGGSYIIKNPECSDVHAVDVMNTFTGSDLTGLLKARQMLTDLLNDEKMEGEVGQYSQTPLSEEGAARLGDICTTISAAKKDGVTE